MHWSSNHRVFFFLFLYCFVSPTHCIKFAPRCSLYTNACVSKRVLCTVDGEGLQTRPCSILSSYHKQSESLNVLNLLSLPLGCLVSEHAVWCIHFFWGMWWSALERDYFFFYTTCLFKCEICPRVWQWSTWCFFEYHKSERLYSTIESLFTFFCNRFLQVRSFHLLEH